MSIEDMAMRGEVVPEPLTSGEVDRLRAALHRRLEDAARTENHPETRLVQAYHAVFACGWIALRVDGWRAVRRPGQHVTVIESLAETLGLEGDAIDYFLALSRQRHGDLYEGTPISLADAEEALSEAMALAERLDAWLEVRDVGDP